MQRMNSITQEMVSLHSSEKKRNLCIKKCPGEIAIICLEYENSCNLFLLHFYREKKVKIAWDLFLKSADVGTLIGTNLHFELNIKNYVFE